MEESPFVAKFEPIIKNSLSVKFVLRRDADLLCQRNILFRNY